MVDDRNDEVHESGSSRSEGQEVITLAIGMSYLDDEMGPVTIGGPPDMPPMRFAAPPGRIFTLIPGY